MARGKVMPAKIRSGYFAYLFFVRPTEDFSTCQKSQITASGFRSTQNRPRLHSPSQPTTQIPRRCTVFMAELEPEPRGKPYCRLSLPIIEGLAGAARDSLRFTFRWFCVTHHQSRTPQGKGSPSVNFSFDPPRLTLLKPSQTTDSSAAESFRIFPSGDGIHQRYSEPQASQR